MHVGVDVWLPIAQQLNPLKRHSSQKIKQYNSRSKVLSMRAHTRMSIATTGASWR